MKFKSINEFETFHFKDAALVSLKFSDDIMQIEAEGVITDANNSNNARYQDMYIVMMELVLSGFKLHRFVEQGYAKYDMDGKLVNVVPDVVLDENQIKYVTSRIRGAYIFNLGKQADSDLYELVFDVEAESDDEFEKTYEIDFSFEGSKAEWDRFAGPVEK